MNQTLRSAAINGTVVGIGTTPLWFMAYLVIGIFTGVLGLCASASEWWAKLYFAGFALVPILIGTSVGLLAARSSYKHNSKASLWL